MQIALAAGPLIERFGDPCADPELAEAGPDVDDTRVAPIFLHVRAHEPA